MRLNIVNKRLLTVIDKLRKANGKLKFNLGALALCFASIMLLIISVFTQIKFSFNLPESFYITKFDFEYIAQIPVVIFIAALLGRRWSLLVILTYILIGLFAYPIFSLGGGLEYIFKYSFGYILAYLFAAYTVSKTLRRKKKRFNTFLAPFYGVLVIHTIGILYMIIIALRQGHSIDFILDLIYYHSLATIFYDIIFSVFAIFLARFCRKFLWLITK